MKVGDLIQINIPQHLPGALTAVKFFGRLSKRTQGLNGIVIADHGNSISALFGDEILVVAKKHAKVVDNRANTSQNEV